jgi:hypothetical protein
MLMGLHRYLWPKFYPFSYKVTPDCMYSTDSVTCYFATQVMDGTPVLPTPQCHYTVPLVYILQSLKLRSRSFVIQYTSWKHDKLSNISFQALTVGATQATVFWVITQYRIIQTVAPQHSGSLGPGWSRQLWDNYSQEFPIEIIITLHHHLSLIFWCHYRSRKRYHKVVVHQ